MQFVLLPTLLYLILRVIVVSFTSWTRTTHVGSERQAQSNTGLGKQKRWKKFRMAPCFTACIQDIPPANPAASRETKVKINLEASFIKFIKLG